MSILRLVATFLGSLFKSTRQLVLENLALKQQVAMLRQSVRRPRATPADRLFWILFARFVDGWRDTLHALHPDTVVRWHRTGFRLYWRWKSRGPKPGRPPIDSGLRKLIREMQATNMGWGASGCGPPEFTENCSSLGLTYPRQQSPNILSIGNYRLRKPGERFSPIMQTVWWRWIF